MQGVSDDSTSGAGETFALEVRTGVECTCRLNSFVRSGTYSVNTAAPRVSFTAKSIVLLRAGCVLRSKSEKHC